MQARTSVGRDFQDNILDQLMRRGQVATLYLRNRMALRGRVLKFDPYVLLLEPLDGSPPQLVYKSALVSVSGPRQMGPGRGPSRGPRPGGPREGGEHRGRRPHGEHAPFPRQEDERPRFGPPHPRPAEPEP